MAVEATYIVHGGATLAFADVNVRTGLGTRTRTRATDSPVPVVRTVFGVSGLVTRIPKRTVVGMIHGGLLTWLQHDRLVANATHVGLPISHRVRGDARVIQVAYRPQRERYYAIRLVTEEVNEGCTAAITHKRHMEHREALSPLH